MTWEFDEKTQAERFVIASTIGCGIIAAFVLFSPLAFPGEDWWALVRKLILFVPMAVVGIICITGALLFVDFVSKRAWLNKIEETEYGTTILFSVIAYVVGRLLVGS